jgi:hypothetical protein
MDRPALQRLLADVRARRIDVIVVYKVDRLTRSLADFAKLVELFDKHDVSFVSVTQSFNTTTSMGRLTLNVLLPSPNSNERSRASGSGTRSPLQRRRECGWAAWSRWATGSRIAPCASGPPPQLPIDGFGPLRARPTPARSSSTRPSPYCKREIIQGRFATVRSYRAPHFPLQLIGGPPIIAKRS